MLTRRSETGVASLIDELYYEHHVRLSPMAHKGWERSLVHTVFDESRNETLRESATEATLQDSYAIFHRLREMGIRAHSWV